MSYNVHKQLVDTRKLSGFVYILLMSGMSPKLLEAALQELEAASEQQFDSVSTILDKDGLLPLYNYACACAKRLL